MVLSIKDPLLCFSNLINNLLMMHPNINIHFVTLLMYDALCHMCRFELTGLPSPAVVEGVAIKTSTNAAYEMMKQGGEPEEGYEEVASPPRGPPPANQEVMYEVLSPPPSHDPLPAIPPPVAAAGEQEEEEEEGVYEIIPGDQ